MNAHVLLNLVNKVGKSDKMEGLPSLIKYFNTGAGMLDSIYHMTSKLIENIILGVKTSRFVIFTHHYNGCHYVTLLNL